MRYVALLVGLVITGLLAVVVMRALADTTSDTLASAPSVVAPTTTPTTTAGGVALPGPGGPLVTDTVATPVGPVIGGIDAATRLACEADKKNLETVIEAYQALEGNKPASEQVLVDAGLLRHASDYWDVADGVIVAQNPRCT